MSGLKGMGADLIYAWPIAEFSVEASTLDYGKVLGDCIEEDAHEAYWKTSRERSDAFAAAHSWTAQVVDEIILPRDTRKKIIQALRILEKKEESLPVRKKMHGSAPT